MSTKADFYAIMAEWSGYLSTYMTREQVDHPDYALLASYYDGALCQYKLADYFSNTATYYPRATKYYASYSTYYGRNNTVGSPFTLPGNWCFGEGLAERYTREADAGALTDLQTCAQMARIMHQGRYLCPMSQGTNMLASGHM